MIQRHLHGRVADDNVSPDDVAFDPRDEDDPVRIAKDRVVLYHVAVGASCNQADAEVVTLFCVAVAAQPVLTEPVMAGARGQSYAATRCVRTPIAIRDILYKLVVRSSNDDDSRKAITRQRDVLHHATCTLREPDAEIVELLHEAGPLNDVALLVVDSNPGFTWPARAARGVGTGQPGYSEAIQFQL